MYNKKPSLKQKKRTRSKSSENSSSSRGNQNEDPNGKEKLQDKKDNNVKFCLLDENGNAESASKCATKLKTSLDKDVHESSQKPLVMRLLSSEGKGRQKLCDRRRSSKSSEKSSSSQDNKGDSCKKKKISKTKQRNTLRLYSLHRNDDTESPKNNGGQQKISLANSATESFQEPQLIKLLPSERMDGPMSPYRRRDSKSSEVSSSSQDTLNDSSKNRKLEIVTLYSSDRKDSGGSKNECNRTLEKPTTPSHNNVKESEVLSVLERSSLVGHEDHVPFHRKRSCSKSSSLERRKKVSKLVKEGNSHKNTKLYDKSNNSLKRKERGHFRFKQYSVDDSDIESYRRPLKIFSEAKATQTRDDLDIDSHRTVQNIFSHHKRKLSFQKHRLSRDQVTLSTDRTTNFQLDNTRTISIRIKGQSKSVSSSNATNKQRPGRDQTTHLQSRDEPFSTGDVMTILSRSEFSNKSGSKQIRKLNQGKGKKKNLLYTSHLNKDPPHTVIHKLKRYSEPAIDDSDIDLVCRPFPWFKKAMKRKSYEDSDAELYQSLLDLVDSQAKQITLQTKEIKNASSKSLATVTFSSSEVILMDENQKKIRTHPLIHDRDFKVSIAQEMNETVNISNQSNTDLESLQEAQDDNDNDSGVPSLEYDSSQETSSRDDILLDCVEINVNLPDPLISQIHTTDTDNSSFSHDDTADSILNTVQANFKIDTIASIDINVHAKRENEKSSPNTSDRKVSKDSFKDNSFQIEKIRNCTENATDLKEKASAVQNLLNNVGVAMKLQEFEGVIESCDVKENVIENEDEVEDMSKDKEIDNNINNEDDRNYGSSVEEDGLKNSEIHIPQINEEDKPLLISETERKPSKKEDCNNSVQGLDISRIGDTSTELQHDDNTDCIKMITDLKSTGDSHFLVIDSAGKIESTLKTVKDNSYECNSAEGSENISDLSGTLEFDFCETCTDDERNSERIQDKRDTTELSCTREDNNKSSKCCNKTDNDCIHIDNERKHIESDNSICFYDKMTINKERFKTETLHHEQQNISLSVSKDKISDCDCKSLQEDTCKVLSGCSKVSTFSEVSERSELAREDQKSTFISPSNSNTTLKSVKRDFLCDAYSQCCDKIIKLTDKLLYNEIMVVQLSQQIEELEQQTSQWDIVSLEKEHRMICTELFDFRNYFQSVTLLAQYQKNALAAYWKQVEMLDMKIEDKIKDLEALEWLQWLHRFNSAPKPLRQQFKRKYRTSCKFIARHSKIERRCVQKKLKKPNAK